MFFVTMTVTFPKKAVLYFNVEILMIQIIRVLFLCLLMVTVHRILRFTPE